jgi:23S rRNA (guanine745-N1)-methyltransferase
MLLCAVRGCRLALTRNGSRFVCPRNHSFDIARTGYVNLLQPQDRRSRNPGDTAEAVAGRRLLHDRGVTAPLLDAISATLSPSPAGTVLDAGCGEGFYLGNLQRRYGFDAYGIDISIPAIDAAARRYPACSWVVANADRFIPFADRSFSLLTSITARMNVAEFSRVLAPAGRLLLALPAPGDLVEIRGPGRDRAPRTIEEFSAAFTLQSQQRVTTTAQLDEAEVAAIRHAIYRPLQSEPAQSMTVTFSLDLLLFRLRA